MSLTRPLTRKLTRSLTRGLINGGGVVPPEPPSGFVFLIDNDGAYLTDQDGAYFMEAI